MDERKVAPIILRPPYWPGNHRQASTASTIASSASSAASTPPRGPGTAGLWMACLAVARSIVGPAALYMPHGFASAGLSAALIILSISSLLFIIGQKTVSTLPSHPLL